MVLAIKGDLRGRQDVVDQLEEVVSKMKYAPVKLKAQRYIEEIKKNVESFPQNPAPFNGYPKQSEFAALFGKPPAAVLATVNEPTGVRGGANHCAVCNLNLTA